MATAKKNINGKLCLHGTIDTVSIYLTKENNEMTKVQQLPISYLCIVKFTPLY